nr:MAG TPA: hypothetical protein [Bacteriophage sp.]
MDDTPLFEVLFDINYQLCKEFPAMTPYDIEKHTFHDVIRLYSDVRALQLREAKRGDNDSNDNRVIRRPAGDDWF